MSKVLNPSHFNTISYNINDTSKMAMISTTTNQTIASGSITTITLNVLIKTNPYYDLNTYANSIKVNQNGYYLLTFSTFITALSDPLALKYRAIYLYKNDQIYTEYDISIPNGGDSLQQKPMTLSYVAYADAGDYFSVKFYCQNNVSHVLGGGRLNIWPTFSAIFVSN